jgi:hypothetical protein
MGAGGIVATSKVNSTIISNSVFENGGQAIPEGVYIFFILKLVFVKLN